MNCQHVEELMGDALGGEIADADRAILEHHLSTCADCRSQYERSNNSLEALRRLSAVPGVAFRRDGERLTIEPLRKIRWRHVTATHSWLRYAACILVAFIAGYIAAAGRETASVLEHANVARRESPSPMQTGAPRPAGTTLEAAITAVHLQHPNESPLTKCLLAMARPRNQPGR